MATVYQTRWVEDGSMVVMARIIAKDATGTTVTGGKCVKQADLSTITYGVRDNTGGSFTVAAGTSLTISAVIFDTLQTPAFWTADSVGYNFLWVIPASAFATGGSEYQAEFKFTVSGGEVFWFIPKGNAEPIYTS